MGIKAHLDRDICKEALTSSLDNRTNMQQYHWLDSLPIATAIYQFDEQNIGLISQNKAFTIIMQSFNDLNVNEYPDIFYMICGMIENGQSQYSEYWHSEKFIPYRQLDINIARYNKVDNLFIISFFDKTSEETNRINLRREMMTDSLTGLSNRVGFEDKIEEKIRQDRKSAVKSHDKFAIIIWDMARFSHVNQFVGTMAGDELILTIASRLNSNALVNEFLARLNGNEFALFMQYDGPDDVVKDAAGRLKAAFDQPCQLADLEIQVECAISSAVGYAQKDNPMDILRHAQIALKKAKHSKNYELYTSDAMHNVKHRFSIETDLRRAIEGDELSLNYQPLIDLETGKLNGFEALVRWNDASRGSVSPVDFIPVAEESGLIIPLGRWVLKEAAKQLKQWDREFGSELPLKMSINMSAVQLVRDDFAYAVSDAMRNANISGDRITIELTESAFIEDPDNARKVMESLKALNTCLAMDDFGTGYSNLAYLQQLPIDVLKIDRSFVTDMIRDKDKYSIVSAVLSLANSLGMKTTAEGIETQELSQLLTGLGCSYGQGFYYAEPLNRQDACAYLLANKFKEKL